MAHDCIDCKYFKEQLDGNDICTATNKEVVDYNPSSCPHFIQLKFCDTCAYANIVIYKTGTIDEITYKCTLQNNKVIYSDVNFMQANNSEYPECNIDCYEETH
jgi:hypothetical protein